MNMSINKAYSGFTLIEMVMVIAITGILAAIVAVFIRAPVQGYFDSVSRAELTDAADTALRRMSRDVRLALPNSIRTDASGNFVEFLLAESGGRYLDEEDDPAGNFLSFDNAADTQFDVVGPAPQIATGSQLVVYNLGPGMDPADAYAGGNRATVTGVAGNTITLASNPFASQTPSMRSPGRRFQVVTTPVSYGCVGNQLVRYWGYAITEAQSTPPDGSSAKVADGVTGCTFNYGNAANIRSGLIGISLTLTNNDESVTLFQQVHVANTP